MKLDASLLTGRTALTGVGSGSAAGFGAPIRCAAEGRPYIFIGWSVQCRFVIRVRKLLCRKGSWQ